MRTRTMFAVGKNDADYLVTQKVNGRLILCPFYQVWRNMLSRCYSAVSQRKCPSYVGCVVDDAWHSFMEFRQWMDSQEWIGRELDKDLIGDGNLYSQATCVFVPQFINSFMNDNKARRGVLPIGVSPNGLRFRARISICGKDIHLGSFDTAAEAHAVWLSTKASHAISIANQQTDSRIASGLRKYAAMLLKSDGEFYGR